MRLIDADALQKAIPDVEADFFENCGNCHMLSKEDVLEIIEWARKVTNYTVGLPMAEQWGGDIKEDA